MNMIHESVKIHDSVKMGYFNVIEEGVTLGEDVQIGNHVTIYQGTKVAKGVRIADGAVLGKQPTPAKTSTMKLSGEIQPLVLGEGVTIGSNSVLYAGAEIGPSTLVADLATVRENVQIKEECIIGRGATIENFVTIGKRVKVQSNAYITAHSNLEDFAFVAPCVVTTNDNFMGRTEERFSKIKGATIKKGARVGGASILLPGVIIAEETFVAAGALVTKNTEEKTVVKGFPAKISKMVDERELL
ncbi:acyltransferase [Lederbergia citri]|uniref:N-acetyltransferase n=1 Tax=Lederbergia citri TaxID=2833580 RepID=A0A942TF78_9BACI|nr:acyltransferase [Lederbergia citri]MBS4195733.1 N-acetyltransferase [Lederbergia citri]